MFERFGCLPICIDLTDETYISPVEIADINEAIIDAGYQGVKLVRVFGTIETHGYDLSTVEGNVMAQIITSVRAGVMQPPSTTEALEKIKQFYKENALKDVSNDYR